MAFAPAVGARVRAGDSVVALAVLVVRTLVRSRPSRLLDGLRAWLALPMSRRDELVDVGVFGTAIETDDATHSDAHEASTIGKVQIVMP